MQERRPGRRPAHIGCNGVWTLPFGVPPQSPSRPIRVPFMSRGRPARVPTASRTGPARIPVASHSGPAAVPFSSQVPHRCSADEASGPALTP